MFCHSGGHVWLFCFCGGRACFIGCKGACVASPMDWVFLLAISLRGAFYACFPILFVVFGAPVILLPLVGFVVFLFFWVWGCFWPGVVWLSSGLA